MTYTATHRSAGEIIRETEEGFATTYHDCPVETWDRLALEVRAPTCAECGGENHVERLESSFWQLILAVCDQCGHAVEI